MVELTEHMQVKLARGLIDKAKGMYNVKLNENIIREAIARAQEPETEK